jgi:murein DD-endopeptidase MepM/ murein hydrolase activator NlpD
MHIRSLLRCGVLMVFALAFLTSQGSLSTPPAYAQDVDAIQEQIDDINRQREAIEREIAEYQRQLNEVAGQRQTLQGSIRSLDISRNRTSAQIRDIEKKIRGANLRLDKLGIEMRDKEKQITVNQAAVAAAIRAIDSADDRSLVEMLLGSADLTEAWTTVDNLQSISRALHQHSDALSEARRALAGQQESVASTKNELTGANDDLTSQQRALDINRRETSTLLKQTQSQESAYQALIAQKRAEQATFEAALFQLASQLTNTADPSTIPTPSGGILSWPLDNVRITQYFGKTAFSGRLYASGTHDGIDLAAAVGTPVRAALSGTISEINEGSAPNCQYGKWVLVKHANGLATLYAHLSSISVSAGQSVTSGQVIGYAGMTGYATGPHLHFTVYQASAVTFRSYTCRSGAVVRIPIAPPDAYLDPMAYL